MNSDSITTLRSRRARWAGPMATLAALSLACSGDDGHDAAAGDGALPPAADDGADDDGADDDGADGGAPPIGPGVGQGGAQDFGQLRAILEAGGIPGPDTLDDVGFFNEHVVPLPAPECGDDVCLHGALGVVASLLDGSASTIVLLGMNTPLDPATIERPPLHLVIAIDTSGSMAGEPLEHVREGLLRMADALRPEDRVSLVGFGDAAEVLVEDTAGGSAALQLAIARLEADGLTNLYDGLRQALELAAAHADATSPLLRQSRVLLLSDGDATTGLLGDDRLLELATDFAIEGVGLSTVGLGLEFDPALMRGLSERGGGAFYFIEDHAAVEEVFEQEASALLLPIASEVAIDVDLAPGYQLRGLYGTKLATVGSHAAHLEIPSLHVAHREAADDVEGGRRGGGGVIVAELSPEPGASPEGDRVGALTLRYRVPGTDAEVLQHAEITSPLAPGEIPPAGLFTDAGAQKAFVTLELYLGLRRAAERAAVGDGGGALVVLQTLQAGVSAWLTAYPDADIEDDLRYVAMFIDNLVAHGAVAPAWP